MENKMKLFELLNIYKVINLYYCFCVKEYNFKFIIGELKSMCFPFTWNSFTFLF